MASELRPDLARLSAPPRSIGALKLGFACTGNGSVMSGLLLLMIPSSLWLGYMVVLTKQWPLLCFVAMMASTGVGMIHFSLSHEQTINRLRALQYGVVAMGTLLRAVGDEHSDGEGTSIRYVYVFEYVDERGERREFEHISGYALPGLEDEAFEPILYVPDERGSPILEVPFDSIMLAQVDRRGQLRLKPQIVAIIALQVIATLGVLLFILLGLTG
jgi:hypothetical protein